MKLRIDYDKFIFRMVDTFNMLNTIPTPYDVRISASGEGLHIRKEGDYTYDDPLYTMYDDPRRLRMNKIRQRAGVSHNLLWAEKPYTQQKKEAGSWHRIRDLVDVWRFVVQLSDTANVLYSTESLIYPSY